MVAGSARPPRWWVAPVIGVVVLFTGVGAVVARTWYQAPSTAAPVVVGSSVVPSPPAGSTEVRLTDDVASYPLGGKVQRLLQGYFDAVNSKNYDQWSRVVSANLLATKPESTWQADFRSTQDSDVLVYRIEQAPQGGLRVLLTFTSKQDVADAPPDLPSSCIRWRVVWSLAQERTEWKLDTTANGKAPGHDRC